MDGIQKRKGFIATQGHVQIHQHTAVVFPLQLILGNLHLGVSILQGIHHIIVQGDITLVHLVIEEHKHID